MIKTKTGPQSVPAFKVEEFGGFFRIDDGWLEYAAAYADGSEIDEDDWCQVEDLYPEMASYLNARLGTDFEANVVAE